MEEVPVDGGGSEVRLHGTFGNAREREVKFVKESGK